jgi:hypothetical protein
MSKRPDDEKLDVQSQKKVKLSSQEIEVSSNTQEIQLKVSPIFFDLFLKNKWISRSRLVRVSRLIRHLKSN